MWTVLKTYHADLVRRGTAGASADVGQSVFDLNRIALPWLVPFFVTLLVGALAGSLAGSNAERVRIGVVLFLCLPVFVGMLCAMFIYLIAFTKAERQKRRSSVGDAPPD
tara:strand:- start:4 stop:330 length:327 start_codon:yes stop_codon:yes gene_type:complete